MKRFASLLLMAFMLSSFLKSQTVDSIRVEQAGDFVKIRYKILNSNPDQIYRVKVLCSINGGLYSEIKSITGDVGDQIIGGKSEYWAVWDVLKDVDEVKSVDFSVRAELIKDNTPNKKALPKTLSERRFHVFLVAGGPPLGQKGPAKIGAEIGYLRSWGITAMYLKGKDDSGDLGGSEPVFVLGIDLTKRIVNAKKFNVHLYTGLNISRIMVEPILIGDQTDFLSNCMGLDLGYIWSINRLAFTTRFTFFPESWVKEDATYTLSGQGKIYGNIGIGYRF